MSERILLVDDDQTGREVSRHNLAAAGHQVDTAADGRQALERFSPQMHQLVVTDLRMPRVSGMELLAEVRKQAPDVPVLVITAHGSVEAAVQAMRAGAYDFLEKPFSKDVLLMAVQRALDHRRLALENRALRLRATGVEREMVFASPAMEALLQTVDRVAPSEVSVLITGDSGTGKELVARRLHARSPRAERPFVAVSCAAMPAELLESELFGHKKGAYTGASRDRAGRFRRADGGTLFLDEVAELPPSLQGKLLRVLQEKLVDVVGSDRPVPVDVRVVAATNRQLPELIKEGAFREDLYYRLNVVELQVPPLRQRPEDIEVLARFFVERAGGDRELVLPDEVLDALRRRPWPGNVRELENACERLAVLAQDDTLRVEDLPPPAAADAADAEPWPPLPPGGLSLVDLEREVIQRALEQNRWNVSRTAAYLRIPRHVLAYRIEKYGLRRDR
jgi:two-component system NtrC family response regulator